MKLIIPLGLFFVMILLGACIRQDIVPINLKNATPKLVVFGYLTPGNTIQVYVGRTLPFGEPSITRKDFREVNATVMLKNETGEEIILKKPKENEPIYLASQKDFPIEKGKAYSLCVEAPNYPTVHATTKVPLEKAIWKAITLYPEEVGFTMKGSWDALSDESEIDYNVSVSTVNNNNSLDPNTNQIVSLDESYEVRQDVYFYNNATTQTAYLFTLDKKSADFRNI